ncbi:hypothetical protein Tco_1117050 [Tanacetum coccineum]
MAFSGTIWCGGGGSTLENAKCEDDDDEESRFIFVVVASDVGNFSVMNDDYAYMVMKRLRIVKPSKFRNERQLVLVPSFTRLSTTDAFVRKTNLLLSLQQVERVKSIVEKAERDTRSAISIAQLRKKPRKNSEGLKRKCSNKELQQQLKV